LDTIDTATADGRKVYVHCRGGIKWLERPFAAFFVRRNSGPEAWMKSIDLSPDRAESSCSPETKAQMQFVHDWSYSPSLEREGRKLSTAIEKCRGLDWTSGHHLWSVILDQGPVSKHITARSLVQRRLPSMIGKISSLAKGGSNAYQSWSGTKTHKYHRQFSVGRAIIG
jgi:hypothetical protein